MMRWIKWLTLLCLPVLAAGAWRAQETGQICVLSFDDRNENGIRDGGEPPITRGIGIHLLKAGGVTIESKLLENSPNAARGLACLEELPAGDYRVILTSADYTAIASSSFDAAVAPGAAPMRFDFGVKPLTSANSTAAAPAAISADRQDQALQGILFATAASLTVGGLMLIIGLLIYFGGFRPRLKRELALPPAGFDKRPLFDKKDTDQMRAV